MWAWQKVMAACGWIYVISYQGLRSGLPGSKLTFSTNLIHHSLLAPTRTTFSDYTGTGLTVLSGFSFVFIFLFMLSRTVD